MLAVNVSSYATIELKEWDEGWNGIFFSISRVCLIVGGGGWWCDKMAGIIITYIHSIGFHSTTSHIKWNQKDRINFHSMKMVYMPKWSFTLFLVLFLPPFHFPLIQAEHYPYPSVYREAYIVTRSEFCNRNFLVHLYFGL